MAEGIGAAMAEDFYLRELSSKEQELRKAITERDTNKWLSDAASKRIKELEAEVEDYRKVKGTLEQGLIHWQDRAEKAEARIAKGFWKEGTMTFVIEEREYPHDHRCEGNMCMCGLRARREKKLKGGDYGGAKHIGGD